MGTTSYKKIQRRRWLIAIVTFLALALFPAAWLFNRKAGEIQQDIKTLQENEEPVEEQVDIPEKSATTGEPAPANVIIKRLTIPLPNQETPAQVTVYWSTVTSSIYLDIESLSPLPVGKKYEVTAITQNKRKNLGWFEAPADNRLIVPVEEALFSSNYEIRVIKDTLPSP